MPVCEICKLKVGANNYRLGVCFDCAEAESIITDGSDMSDKCMEGSATPRGKLLYLINKGWGTRAMLLSGEKLQPTNAKSSLRKFLRNFF